MEAKYFFAVGGMTPNLSARPRFSARGMWLPPKAFGNNLASPHPLLFRHNGQVTRHIDALPGGCSIYRTYSLYYSSGNIWVLPYDATRSAVHDGDDRDDGDEHETASSESCDESDDELDNGSGNGSRPHGRSALENRGEDGYPPDWAQLSFGTPPGDRSYISYAGHKLEHIKLRKQRENQQWAQYLLPDRYQKAPRSNNPRHGGLVGDLPLLLGIVAMSLPQDQNSLIHGIPRIVTSPWQIPQGFERYVPRGNEWTDGKGIVVTVFHREGETSQRELRRYERGSYGPIFN